MFPVVILCGGLAKRMRPLTQDIPKSLIPIQGEPFIIHQLRLLQRQGIREVVLCVGYLGEQIKTLLGNGRDMGLQIRYSFEGHTLLGTAGAIINAKMQLPQRFFMLYGDSYLPCDFKKVAEHFTASGKLALMTVYHNQDRFDSSNVVFENQHILTYDKLNKTADMQHIDYGLSCFDKSIFDAYTPGVVMDLAELYVRLIKQNQLAGFEVCERFYEIGSFKGKAEFEKVAATI